MEGWVGILPHTFKLEREKKKETAFLNLLARAILVL